MLRSRHVPLPLRGRKRAAALAAVAVVVALWATAGCKGSDTTISGPVLEPTLPAGGYLNPIDGARVRTDERTLVLSSPGVPSDQMTYIDIWCRSGRRPTVRPLVWERPDTVTIALSWTSSVQPTMVQPSTGMPYGTWAGTAICPVVDARTPITPVTYVVELRAPLGDRMIVDESTGRRLVAIRTSELLVPEPMPAGWQLMSDRAGAHCAFEQPKICTTSGGWLQRWGDETHSLLLGVGPASSPSFCSPESVRPPEMLERAALAGKPADIIAGVEDPEISFWEAPAAPLLAWQIDDRCYTAELFGETGDHHALVTALLGIATTLQPSERTD